VPVSSILFANKQESLTFSSSIRRSLNEVLEVLGQKVDQINRTVGDASKDLLTVLKVSCIVAHIQIPSSVIVNDVLIDLFRIATLRTASC